MIYIVEDIHEKPMEREFAVDAEGVEAIVREHHRKHYDSAPHYVDVDMVNLTVTVFKVRYRRTYQIVPLQRRTCLKQSTS